MLGRDLGDLGRHAGVDLGAVHVDGLRGEREHLDRGGGREQRALVAWLDGDQGGARTVANDDVTRAPVALPPLKVRQQVVRRQLEPHAGDRYLPVGRGSAVARHGRVARAWTSIIVSARSPSRSASSPRRSRGSTLLTLTSVPTWRISHACWSLRGASNTRRSGPTPSNRASTTSARADPSSE